MTAPPEASLSAWRCSSGMSRSYIARTANTSCSVTVTENAELHEWELSARMTFAATEKGKKTMTLENAIKTLDDVIPPHTHNTVDREHMPIVLAWEAVKVELENREPVVHFKDCLHYCECVCDYHAAAVCADWFCWGGERRTDEQ